MAGPRQDQTLTIKEHEPGPDGMRKWGMAGDLCENADFTGLVIAPQDRIQIDLSAVRSCNSTGILIWCRFVTSVPDTSRMTLIRVPLILVHHFNLVPSMLNHPGVKVRTFEMQYVCGECSTTSTVLMDVNDARLEPEGIRLPAPACRACASAMHIDGISSKELMFLKRQLTH